MQLFFVVPHSDNSSRGSSDSSDNSDGTHIYSMMATDQVTTLDPMSAATAHVIETAVQVGLLPVLTLCGCDDERHQHGGVSTSWVV